MKMAPFCLLLLLCAHSGGAAEGDLKFVEFGECIPIPIRIHLLSSGSVTDANTRLQTADVNRVIDKANRIWLQAGILLVPELIAREEVSIQETASQFPLTANASDLLRLRDGQAIATNALNLYYIHEFDVNGIYFPKAIFVKDAAILRSVEGGIDEPLPRVTAHEIGHAFGLVHRQSRTNLMASGTTGIWLNPEEIEIARRGARNLNARYGTNGIKMKGTKQFYDRAVRFQHVWNESLH